MKKIKRNKNASKARSQGRTTKTKYSKNKVLLGIFAPIIVVALVLCIVLPLTLKKK